MLKQSILIVSTALFFSACSLKMPTFEMPSFLSFSKDSTKDLEEANSCQKIESDEGKLTCYKNMETKDSFAQIRLGTYYADKKDYQTSLKYLKQAKENKNLFANLPLAFLYYKGEGVEKNIPKSFELLDEAKDSDPVAAFQLSRFYIQGINTKIDYEKGIELLEFAASKNVLSAQQLLINIYKNGLFSKPKDQKKVEYWQNKVKENKEDLNLKIYRL